MSRQSSPRHDASGIAESERARLVNELRRLLVAVGPTEVHGSAPKRIAKLRANVRQGLNRAPETLVDLLLQSGQADAVAGYLRSAMPTSDRPALTLVAACVAETDAECSEDGVEARVIAGDTERRTIRLLATTAAEHEAKLETVRLLCDDALYGAATTRRSA